MADILRSAIYITYVGVTGEGVADILRSAIYITYMGAIGEEEDNNFTKRLGQHIVIATNPCQIDTSKPIGCHFRMPGHKAQHDMVMLPIVLIRGSEIFHRMARERFNINKFQSEKRKGVTELEHGLNLDPGHGQ